MKQDKYAVYNRWGEFVVGGHRTTGNVFDSYEEAEEYRKRIVNGEGINDREFPDEKFAVVKLKVLGNERKLEDL